MSMEHIFLLVILIKLLSPGVMASQSELYFHLLRSDDDDDQFNQYHRQTNTLPRTGNNLPHIPFRSRLPTPSDRLPVDDLIENEDTIYDPHPKDINIKLLRRKLGTDYNKQFMSIHKPKPKRRKILSIHMVNGRPAGTRPSFLKLLRRAKLQDGSKIKLHAKKNERRKFQKYIWSLTHCPVRYTWKNLGIRFWPTWIRKGNCTNERSCSIPAGMRCKPTGFINMTFLRWHCGEYETRLGCDWIKVQLPIVQECSCAC